MNASLLRADLDELDRIGAPASEAFARGSACVGSRPTHERAVERPGTRAAIEELVHLYAEAYAQMRLLQFAYTTNSRNYEQSKGRYETVEDSLYEARRTVVPALRTRLGQVKEREEALVRELEARGRSPEAIGPLVPRERSQETSLRPGEGPIQRRTLPPLPPRPSLLGRLRGTRRR